MEQRKQILAKLNNVLSFREKAVLKFDEMEINKKYIVNAIKGVNTIYGKKILIETNENVIFLPQRFNVIDDAEVQNLNRMCEEELTIVRPDKYNINFE